LLKAEEAFLLTNSGRNLTVFSMSSDKKSILPYSANFFVGELRKSAFIINLITENKTSCASE